MVKSKKCLIFCGLIRSPQKESTMTTLAAAIILACLTYICALNVTEVSFPIDSNTTDDFFAEFPVLSIPLQVTLASMFANKTSEYDGSRCPKRIWLYLMRVADIRSAKTGTRTIKRRYRIMSIGFNKGYSLATYLNTLASPQNVGNQQWHGHLKSVPLFSNTADLCGSCGECGAPALHNVTAADERHLPIMHFAGVDMNKATVEAVQSAFAEMKKIAAFPDKITIDFQHGAVIGATKVQSTKLPKCTAGDDNCRVPADATEISFDTQFDVMPIFDINELAKKFGVMYHDRPGRRKLSKFRPGEGDIRVGPHHTQAEKAHNTGATVISEHPVRHGAKSVTVRSNDHLLGSAAAQHTMKQNHAAEERAEAARKAVVEIIDILEITTGGEEPEILRSAFPLFEARRVRAVTFTYGNSTLWKSHTLGAMVHSLSYYNLACYFQGQGRLWALPSSEWNERYEIYSESNVLCVTRADTWFQAIQPMVVTVDTELK